ncbi:MAG: hypothetical protein SAK29_37640 [Scytonema sp. PMC 1069.18]|nr:hypothetical protein [Scytonema sp. PMC 1069.18]MEC4881069.1 hypothetical protein [Scytonema sp. PMC 1070.18]
MVILIANIGTSDLAIEVVVDGTKYYLPIDPLPEINQDKEGLIPQEQDMWTHPRKYFRESGLYTSLGFSENVEPTSIKLTERLLEQYKNNFEYWHSRIHAPRIWGVVEKAVRMGINQGYIFVTNQQSEKFPEGHEKDTRFLYEILELWFKDKYPNFVFIPEVIPQNVRVYIPDDLFQYYYDFFNRISLGDTRLKQQKKEEELMLISVKGGTPQMKTALQLQGISVSTVKRLLFVNPQLSIRDVFTGLPSSCDLEAYWRYMRTQKYQTIKLLLERWDFDGAIQILQNWLEYLDYLIYQGILGKDKVEKSRNVSKLVLTVLDFSRSCFNLDFQTAKRLAQIGISQITTYSELSYDIFYNLNEIAEKYEIYQYRLLSLYTQNRIYWRLEQIASFLSHLSSFCEEVLHGLILKWESEAGYWIVKSDGEIKDEFNIDVKKLQNSKGTVWENFTKLQGDFAPKSNKGSYRLTNRYSKRSFVEALVQFRNNKDEIAAWNRLCDGLKQLDFWIDQRNKLIHTATGFSKELMQDLYIGYTPEPNKSAPCAPNAILMVMAAIAKNELVDLKTVDFVGEEADFYIYTFVTDWMVSTLLTDGLQ